MESSDIKKIKKKFNLIQSRIENINSLIGEKDIEPMINFTGKENLESNDDDIRNILPKKNYDFVKVIDQIGGKLLYIKSGSTGHTFRGVYLDPKDPRPSYAVKIVAYPRKENYGDVYDPTRPENAELIMLRVLSQFVLSNQTPHIILPICTFNTSIKQFVSLNSSDFVKNKKYDNFVERYQNHEYYNNVSVLISEWANNGDLMDFLRKKYRKFKIKHWRVLFFQLLSVLAVIHKKYPAFRHNDLKANNILVQKLETNKKHNKYMYDINGQVYVVPNLGFNIKLWDFDFACIPGIVDNAKVSAKWTSKININPQQNRYYDVHYFFNTLTSKGFMPDFFNDNHIPDEVKEFIKRVVPDKYRSGDKISERGRILTNEEYLTPDQILKEDDFFEDFRT